MHNSFHIPSLTDEAVIKMQAERRRDDKRHPEETTVHYHRYKQPCNDRCIVYKLDNKKAVPVKEEQ